MKIVPDNKAAIEFLQRWSPSGPWALTAIQTDRKAISTNTFWPNTLDALEKWLQEFNGKRNIYFHVNSVLRDITKKAEREDIKSLDWLHVDIDPRAGEDLEEERLRALALLTTKLPASVPPPTVIVFSGGGYQGFWRLEDPIEVNGDLSAAENAKRYNQQLELLFGADNCHNIDRIMRLPGTVNIPDAKKLKKGRTPTLAELVEFHDDRVYPLGKFTPAPALQLADEKGFSQAKQTVQISGNIERVADVSELDQWSVPDRVKVILVQGRHPDETKKGDNSRSAWLFDAICQLVRCEVPDEVIFSIVTDPEFGISESVLDKGSNAEKYAIRQIERAKEDVIDPHFRIMNERHAVIGNMGGKCRVIEEVFDGTLKRSRLTKMSFEDIRNRYMNIEVPIGTAPNGQVLTKPLGQFWLKHPHRRQFDTIVFAPGVEVPNVYNMWKGFAYPSRPGKCNLYLEHIRDNICRGDEKLYNYVIGWMARTVQQPGSQGQVAIVLRGGRGTGKSVFAKHFGQLFGRHFMQISNPSHLVGNFNSHLRDVIVLFADEAFFAGDKKHASILKTLITEDTITIEAKGVDAEAAANYVHLIMCSNESHVVPAGGDERRFLVLDVGSEHQKDIAYFIAMEEQLLAGGYEALLHYLMTYDITGFQVRNVPATKALQDQKHLSLSAEEEWWYQCLLEGRVRREADLWETEVRKELVTADYIEHTDRFRVFRRGNETTLGKFLHHVVPTLTTVQKLASWDEIAGDGFTRKVTKRARFYRLPPLDVCRARWDKLYGEENWPDVDAQAELVPQAEKVPF